MRFIEEGNEVLPDFAPAVQDTWKDCGIYVASLEPLVAAKELEFFVQVLVDRIAGDLHEYNAIDVEGILVKLGYAK